MYAVIVVIIILFFILFVYFQWFIFIRKKTTKEFKQNRRVIKIEISLFNKNKHKNNKWSTVYMYNK